MLSCCACTVSVTGMVVVETPAGWLAWKLNAQLKVFPGVEGGIVTLAVTCFCWLGWSCMSLAL